MHWNKNYCILKKSKRDYHPLMGMEIYFKKFKNQLKCIYNNCYILDLHQILNLNYFKYHTLIFKKFEH